MTVSGPLVDRRRLAAQVSGFLSKILPIRRSFVMCFLETGYGDRAGADGFGLVSPNRFTKMIIDQSPRY